MKRLVLIRHSKSSWRHDGLMDEYRPLNERGYTDAIALGAILKKARLRPGRIVCSPAVRTYSTALIVARCLRLDIERITIDNRLYDSGIRDYLKVIKAQPASVNDLLLIGHNETISNLIEHFSGKETIQLPTSGYAIFRYSSENWSLIGKDFLELASVSV